jgi:hypothetical protein
VRPTRRSNGRVVYQLVPTLFKNLCRLNSFFAHFCFCNEWLVQDCIQRRPSGEAVLLEDGPSGHSTRNATARVSRFLSEPQRGSTSKPGVAARRTLGHRGMHRSSPTLPLGTPTRFHIKAQGRRQAHPGSSRNATARLSRFLSEPQRGSTSTPRVAARRTLGQSRRPTGKPARSSTSYYPCCTSPRASGDGK